MNNNFSNDLKALIETYNIENKNVITYIPLDFRQSEIQDSEIPEPLNQVYALFGNHESLLRSKSAYLCKPEQLKRVDMTW